jgi:hypothetical protein
MKNLPNCAIEKFYNDEGVLIKYILTRYTEAHDYLVIETHDYCPYRTKAGIEDSTFTSKWEDNRGNWETFAWNVEKNGVDTINSYASMHVNGVRYYDMKSYKEALKNQ